MNFLYQDFYNNFSYISGKKKVGNVIIGNDLKLGAIFKDYDTLIIPIQFALISEISYTQI